MSHKNQTILIWDSAESPSSGCQRVVLWRSFDCEEYPDAVSIPKIVEQNADILKKRYLKLIYSLGEKKFNGVSTINRLQLRTDFNFWWLSLIVEKCNYSKSTWINDAIRLLAFEDWAANQKINKLELVSANVYLASCFRLFCEKKKNSFTWGRLSEVPPSQPILKRMYKLLPKPLQGLAWLFYYVIKSWSLIGVGLKEWKSTEGRVTFISYLFNLEAGSEETGDYRSKFWAHLPDVFDQDGIATNWLHIYVKDSVLPSSRVAANAIRSFNQQLHTKQKHTTLESFLHWDVIERFLRDWSQLFRNSRKLKKLGPEDLAEDFFLWPLIQIDLNESLYGVTALNNLLYFNLFEKALQLLPRQKKGIYLQENQGWEFALIQAWKEVKYGDLIGVPHSTIRFWDLRYFFDTRSYKDNISNQLPRPDRVAVNGKAARESYIQGDYPQNELVDVEALRYLYLKTFLDKPDPLANNSTHIIVLALGDYLAENTHYQMCILEKAFSSFSQNVKLIVKPHPNCPIIAEDYPSLNMHITMESISKLLYKCDVVYTSSVTSAAIDAYCANVPVISVLNPQTLNMSPLRMVEGVEFINRADELVNAIKNIKNNNYNKIEPEDVFWLDPKLSMWKNLLNLR